PRSGYSARTSSPPALRFGLAAFTASGVSTFVVKRGPRRKFGVTESGQTGRLAVSRCVMRQSATCAQMSTIIGTFALSCAGKLSRLVACCRRLVASHHGAAGCGEPGAGRMDDRLTGRRPVVGRAML